MPRAAFRPSPIFLALVALFVAGGVMTWNGYGNVRFDVFVFVVSGWLVSLCLHEYAHAVVAYRAGDRDIAHRGYLTLNPLKYTSPLLSIVLPVVVVLLGGIGLPGGAVWVDRHAIPGRLRHTLVSLAGPATNVLFTLLLVAAVTWGPARAGRWSSGPASALLAFLQLMASVLNLLPVPGLDGGNMIQPWLSPPTGGCTTCSPRTDSSCSSRCCGARRSAARSSAGSSRSATRSASRRTSTASGST